MIVRGFSFGFIYEKVSFLSNNLFSYISFSCASLVILSFFLQYALPVFIFFTTKKKFLKILSYCYHV
jgi:hypothetical protein